MPRWFRSLLVVALVTTFLSCGKEPSPPRAAPRSVEPFLEIGEQAGVRFRHVNGMNGEFYYPEIIGAGVALFDYNNDGRLDLLALQGTALAPGAPRSSECGARLYRNDLDDTGAQRRIKFTDVTDAARLCTRDYGMGVAIGDFDNDGYPDVFITHFGAPNQLYRNNRDGTFTDVTRKAGVAGDGRWGASVSFVDYDRDGRLDLFVTNYVDYTVTNNLRCAASTSVRDYCAPSSYKPVASMLYRNRGNGTFEDVSLRAGITKAFGAGLGVMAADLNDDSWPDIFVANDGNPNQLWINQKNGTFRNEAPIRGCAVNADGAAEAGMGIDIADFDGNGTEDIFLTHLTREKSTLFFNRGEGYFEDRSVEVGVAAPSVPFTGFGTAFFDYDNDGWLDIIATNGAVHVIEELRSKGDPFPLHQKKQMFRNLGNGRFEDVTPRSGAALQLSEVGRGLAVGDIDNDGAIDFVVNNNNGALRIFHNHIGSKVAWIGLRLVAGKRDAYGAKVEVRRANAPTLWRRVRADGSYLSANDPRVLLGLGQNPQVESVTVHWPDGTNESFPLPPLSRYTTLVQGGGTKANR